MNEFNHLLKSFLEKHPDAFMLSGKVPLVAPDGARVCRIAGLNKGDEFWHPWRQINCFALVSETVHVINAKNNGTIAWVETR